MTIKNSVAHADQFIDVGKALCLKDGLNILDVGCGTGDLEKCLYDNFGKNDFKITAVDFSEKMLAKARKRNRGNPRINYEVVDADRGIEYGADSFDRIVMINAMFAVKEKEKLVSDFRRILKKDGILVIVDPKPDARMIKTIPYAYRKVFSTENMRAKLSLIVDFIIVFPFAIFVLLLNYVMVLWSQKGLYRFCSDKEFVKMLKEADFSRIVVGETLADQDWLVTARV
jgi:ubiquinone/menaquinone biosynthesis C-methylase UbiE